VSNPPEPTRVDLERVCSHWLRVLDSNYPAEEIYASREQILHAMLVAARTPHTWELAAHIASRMHYYMVRWGFFHSWIHLLQEITAPKHIPEPATALLASLNLDLGTVLVIAGEWQAAHDTLIAALQSFHNLGDRFTEQRVRYHLGCLAWYQGEWQATLDQLNEALDEIASLNDPSPPARRLRSQLFDLLGLTHWRIGQPEKALESLHQALACRLVSDLRGQAHTHHHITLPLVDLGKTEAALRHAALAQDLFTRCGDRVGLAYLFTDLSDLYRQRDDLPAARQALRQAYSLWRALEDRSGLADYYRHAGLVERKAGNSSLAQEYFRYARDLWRDLGEAYQMQRCEAYLAGR
jgi:tetratricopeptide (TPR) repeat protein